MIKQIVSLFGRVFPTLSVCQWHHAALVTDSMPVVCMRECVSPICVLLNWWGGALEIVRTLYGLLQTGPEHSKAVVPSIAFFGAK